MKKKEKTQLVLIPKGMANPDEETIVEIPAKFQENKVVVATKKAGEKKSVAIADNEEGERKGVKDNESQSDAQAQNKKSDERTSNKSVGKDDDEESKKTVNKDDDKKKKQSTKDDSDSDSETEISSVCPPACKKQNKIKNAERRQKLKPNDETIIELRINTEVKQAPTPPEVKSCNCPEHPPPRLCPQTCPNYPTEPRCPPQYPMAPQYPTAPPVGYSDPSTTPMKSPIECIDLTETELQELKRLECDLEQFHKARRRLIADTKIFASSSNDAKMSATQIKKSESDCECSRNSSSSSSVKSGTVLGPYDEADDTRATEKEKKPCKSKKRPPAMPVCSDLNMTEAQEAKSMEAALKEFQKARRNLIDKLKGYSC